MIKNKKMIKRDILNKFRTINPEDGYIIPPSWLESDYFEDLDSEEKKIFKKAVNELISKGLVENVKGSELHLKLTRKGMDLIYDKQDRN